MEKLKVTGQRYNIQIGHRGESAARPIVIDIADWLEQWPQGLAVVLVKRPKDRQYYAARNTLQSRDDRILTWKPDATDTEYVAIDPPVEVQVVFSDGDVVLAKTPVWLCRVMPSLDGTETTPPSTESPWIAEVLSAAVQAHQDADRAEQSANEADISRQQAEAAAESAAESAEAASDASEEAGRWAEVSTHNARTSIAAIAIAAASARLAEEHANAAVEAADRAEERSGQTILAAETVGTVIAQINTATAVVDDLVNQADTHEDNARMYSDSAAASARDAAAQAGRSENAADQAENAAIRAAASVDNRGIIEFYLDENGHCIEEYTNGADDIIFSIVDGRLGVEF